MCIQTLEKTEGAIKNGQPEILETLRRRQTRQKKTTTQKTKEDVHVNVEFFFLPKGAI